MALIAGPTASGKSALALAVAERTGGVIINADSAQVYADLRVLSARPSIEEEARAPHRLFGHIDAADRDVSAARWATDAKAALADAVVGGRLPILVGGTGLYLRTLIDGIAPVPPIEPAIRIAVRNMDPEARRDALAREDPPMARQLAPADGVRIARALEVARSTGRSIQHWRTVREGGIGDCIDLRALILLPDRQWLGARIDKRFATMMEDGAEDEVAALLTRTDVPSDAPILRAIGVSEIRARLQAGLSPAETLRRGALASRQYAKRQYTWFRHQPPPSWRRVTASQTISQADLVGILFRDGC